MNGFNLSALAVRERAITLALLLLITAAGIYAFNSLGRAEEPRFTVKQLTVAAYWPGATAREMQDLVAEPLEKRLQELRYYDRVETTAQRGAVYMLVNLRDSTPPESVREEFYQARKKIGDETAKLPNGVIGPYVNDEYSDVSFALYALQAPAMPARDLARQAEALRQDILHVPGVKKVNILGERPERIYVEFSHARLAGMGLSPRQILQNLQLQNELTPAGSISTDGPQVNIRIDGAYNDARTIADTPITIGSRSMKLSDLAVIKREYEEPATDIVRHQGKDALMLSVVMQDGWNGLALGNALDHKVADLIASLPPGVSFEKVNDHAANISQAVDEFMIKFFVSLAVVLLVSLLSLGWRSGIIVAFAIPLTLSLVFVIMLVIDRDFDRITLGALILSLGLLVDDAIIAIEIMSVKLQQGLDRAQAASFAWSHTAAPMLSGTLVTVIGLMPIGFARSSSGEYAGNIFWIVGIALIASWLVAVVFTPFLGAGLLPDRPPSINSKIYDTPRYQRLRMLVRFAVNRKYLVVGAVAIMLIAGACAMSLLTRQFFPTSDRTELLVEVQMPEGTGIDATLGAVTKLENFLLTQPEAKFVSSYVGRGAPRFFTSYAPELPDPSFAKIVVLTTDTRARDELKINLREQIANGLAPEGRVRVTQLLFGPYSQYPIAYRVMGPDEKKVRAIADQVLAVMRNNPHTRTVNRDWGERVSSIRLSLDQERLRLIGLSPFDTAQQMNFLLTGVNVTTVRDGIRSVLLTARSEGGQRIDPRLVGDLTLVSPTGKAIPFDQIGTTEVTSEDPILRRRDRTPTVTARSDVEDGVQPPDVESEISAALKPVVQALPTDYRIEVGGDVEESLEANVALAKVFPIMIVFTMLVIILQVRSFAGMAIVLLTAPLGLLGAVPTLIAFNQPFGFTAILALIALSGILMRNTLILIEQIKTNMSLGMVPYDAIVEATVERAKPVVLTALAAVLAFIPLTFSAFWGAMAFTLIGGTMVGTLVTIVFLPSLYSIFYRIGTRGSVGEGANDEARST
ncbi:efflux RND transporter permease subunit [Rhizobium leguminosarum]|uniref:efflux RND transporter permease subunit n=1 Tax=Rhizobium TaxID=379 RepID=UPI001031E88A|nr:efflux RND transporter permease subunit [Rhizobium leguminosarum]TBF87493.1 efflux RND transporter permease subunit [Rhizobium leguminosarum]TBG06969.1 efflux RND transporter permease subunit [Rhizobium leguminosarum]TBG07840.1 efflux RND transporter permease subunit [Rhizobium leguminosarum]TBG30006.1 efflux RND transporter permease subunit [Rhizobium leguminosarum]TBG50139.1 efflux RND transporter permease subunit [Rhizobium leguminosarum]